MEIYWEIKGYANLIAKMFLMGYVLYRFAKPFMENKRGALFAGLTYFLAMMLLYFIPFQMNNFAAYGLGVLTAFLVMCGMDRRNYRQKLYLAATFFSLRWLSAYMSGMITVKLADYNLYNIYTNGRPVLQFVISAIIEILDLAMNVAILGISVKYIVKAYVYRREDMTTKEMCMLMTPSVTGVIGYGIMQYYQTYFEVAAFEAVFGVYRGLALLYYGISIATIVVMTVIFQNIKVRQEEKLQNELLVTQMDSMKHHIEQVEGLYQNIRSIKHDMANHIFTLERLYEGNKTEEARAYSADLKKNLAEMTGEIKSGNPVTDVILQEIKNEAEKKGIRFHSDFYYPTGSKINVFDISVILNNALQNAIEHAGDSGTPCLSIHSYRRNNAYMIEIKNSFTGNLRWDAETGLPITSKGKGEEHGYGLANIRRVAGKYSGDIDIAQENETFRLSIMLMIE